MCYWGWGLFAGALLGVFGAGLAGGGGAVIAKGKVPDFIATFRNAGRS